MPFFRRRTRFSATPRRSWRRRTSAFGKGTREIRVNYAQALLETGLVIVEPAGPRDKNNPSFIVQALTPWANAPQGGYDRTWELKGLLYQITAFVTNHSIQGTITQGLYAGDNPQTCFSPFGAMFFVDATDPLNGAPNSHFSAPLGPFLNTPPIAATTQPSDDDFMPTRILKRKVGLIQTGAPLQSATGSSSYAIGTSNFRWSGAIRKRVSLSARQGLFLGFYGAPPLGGYLSAGNNIVDVGINISASIVYYFRLTR